MQYQPRIRAFTLIELLVVITIIVVLLALLTPALDKAIYEAELAVCGARHRTIGGALLTYAFDHKRNYPYREGVRDPNVSWWPRFLATPSSAAAVNKSGKTIDDRPMLRPYFTLDAFNCPLSPQIDFENIPAERGLNSITAMWAGMVFTVPGSNGTGMNPRSGGMFRVGDRWTWSEPNIDPVRSSILYGDIVEVNQSGFGNSVSASHQDSNGTMVEVRLDDDGASAAAGAGVSWPAGNFGAKWNGANLKALGTFDLHFAYADGSAQRFNDVPWDANRDSRMEKVGVSQSSQNTAASYNTMPGH